MPKMIQIRNVPEKIHRTLKARAAEAGMSLSEFLLAHLENLSHIPTDEEMQRRLRSLSPVDPSVPPAQIIREERDRG